jgi:hypothetical protein
VKPHWSVKVMEQLAKDVLTLAADGGMPDTFWLTDSRIERACTGLGWTPEQARTWARKQTS